MLIGLLNSCVFLLCETIGLARLHDIKVMIAGDERIFPFLCHLGVVVDRNCMDCEK